MALVPLVAQNAPSQSRERVEAIRTLAHRASFGWGTVVGLLLIAGARPLSQAFTDDAEVTPHIVQYFWIIGGSYGFYGLLMSTTAILNGRQEPRSSLMLLLVKTVALTIPAMWTGAQFGAGGLFAGVALSNVLGAAVSLRWDALSGLARRHPAADATGSEG